MMLLDDCLVGKLSDFTFKSRLNTQVTANCATQGVFATFPASPPYHRECLITPSRRVLLNQWQRGSW